MFDPTDSEYADILREAREIRNEMFDRMAKEEFNSALDLTDKIADLYSPDDAYGARRLAYLIYCVASEAWYASAYNQISKSRPAYVPPF